MRGILTGGLDTVTSALQKVRIMDATPDPERYLNSPHTIRVDEAEKRASAAIYKILYGIGCWSVGALLTEYNKNSGITLICSTYCIASAAGSLAAVGSFSYENGIVEQHLPEISLGG